MSFGTNYDSDILREEIKSVADKGILMIAAAGNDKEADQILYPAAYEEVMAVGGVSADMSPADCSVQERTLNCQHRESIFRYLPSWED